MAHATNRVDFIIVEVVGCRVYCIVQLAWRMARW